MQDDTPAGRPRQLIRLTSSFVRDVESVRTLIGDALRGPRPDSAGEDAVVVDTSGSSGYPKAVVLPFSALRASAEATADRIGAGSWVLALAPTYVAGLQVLVRSALAGTRPAVIAPSFTPADFVAAATRIDGPRYTSLVPAQLTRLLDAAGDEAVAGALRSFAAILVGGQALPPREADRAGALGIRLVRTYGSSETAGGCVYDGVPLPGVGVRIVEGEVQVSGPVLAEGYLGDAARTHEAFPMDPDGVRWYRTGDLGTFDGVLRVTGRRDNVIVSGGVNVSLDRVERVVREIAGLESAVVVPVPDVRWGQASVVVIAQAELRTDGGRDAAEAEVSRLADDVRRRVGAEVGAPARPREVIVVSRLPTLPSGKPDRAALRARLSEPGS